jgi:hypothetical protein
LYSQQSDEIIRRAANSLGVPFNDLKRFVQSYQANDTFVDTIKIDAGELHQAYQSNRIRANNLYRGKILEIVGIVYEIQNDRINLKGQGADQRFVTGWMSVFFKDSELSKVANLEPGKIVTVVGVCEGGDYYVENVKEAIVIQY